MRGQSKQKQRRDRMVVDNKYELRRKLKTGGFASVYIAHSLDENPIKCAVKIMQKKHERYARIENQMYDMIKENKFTLGFIKHYDYGIYNDQLYLAMELIGFDLDDILAKMKTKKFSIKTVLMIGLQVIDRIEALHTIGFVHRDIKPDNLAVGNKQKNNIIYLFDFGLSIKSNAPQLSDQKGKMVGTLGYMSVRCHEGKKSNFYDDIQSFVYTLIYLALGTVPWMQIHIKTPADYHRVKIMKEKLDKDWFKRNNLPLQLYDILEIAREGNEKVKIDYLNIKYKLLSALHLIKQENDFDFDWCGVLKVTYDNQDSPVKKVAEKKKINEMNKSNQKIVQNQIYEIYRFMQNQKKEQQQKQEKIKSKSKSPNKKEQQKQRMYQEKLRLNNQKIETENRKQRQNQRQKMKRPLSSKNPVRAEESEKMKRIHEVERMLKQQGMASFSGPRITINRTANHKI